MAQLLVFDTLIKKLINQRAVGEEDREGAEEYCSPCLKLCLMMTAQTGDLWSLHMMGEEGVGRPHVDSVVWVGFFDYFIIMSFIIIST